MPPVDRSRVCTDSLSIIYSLRGFGGFCQYLGVWRYCTVFINTILVLGVRAPVVFIFVEFHALPVFRSMAPEQGPLFGILLLRSLVVFSYLSLADFCRVCVTEFGMIFGVIVVFWGSPHLYSQVLFFSHIIFVQSIY